MDAEKPGDSPSPDEDRVAKSIKIEPTDASEPTDNATFADNCVWLPVKQENLEALSEEDNEYKQHDFLDIKIEDLKETQPFSHSEQSGISHDESLEVIQTKSEVTENSSEAIPDATPAEESTEPSVKPNGQQPPYKCTLCPKQFKAKHDFTKHSRVHTGIRPYSCKLCDKTFTQIGHLTVHQRGHNGIKPYQCKSCPMKFTTRGALKNHELVHTGYKAFECEHCKKTFSRLDHYKVHQLTHTGVKPFACDICGKQFATKYDLKKHFQVHNAGDTVYRCNLCRKTFRYLMQEVSRNYYIILALAMANFGQVTTDIDERNGR